MAETVPTEPALVPVCAWCRRVSAAGRWVAGYDRLFTGLQVAVGPAAALVPGWYEFTHGMCPECKAERMPAPRLNFAYRTAA